MMRRQERELRNKETIEAILKRSPVGRMATINREGFPIIKPVNFLYWKGKIYIHSSMDGEKIDDIRRGSPTCFEVDEPISYVAAKGSACTASYYYRSILIKGEVHLVEDENKKLEILEWIMKKYQPEGGYERITVAMLGKTAVIEISIKEITGKENLG